MNQDADEMVGVDHKEQVRRSTERDRQIEEMQARIDELEMNLQTLKVVAKAIERQRDTALAFNQTVSADPRGSLSGTSLPTMLSGPRVELFEQLATELARQSRALPVGLAPSLSKDVLRFASSAGVVTRNLTKLATREGTLSWSHVLAEQAIQAIEPATPRWRRDQLMALAATALLWLEAKQP